MKEMLLKKLSDKTATIGIVGMGYVGLPLVLRYCEVGYRVIGFDIDAQKIVQLQEGRSYIKHISSAAIVGAIKGGFEATTDFSRASDVDALIVCVPTPLNKYREPDLSFVLSTIESLLPYLKPGQVVSPGLPHSNIIKASGQACSCVNHHPRQRLCAAGADWSSSFQAERAG